MDAMGGTRGVLQKYVDSGHMSVAEAGEVSELIDTVIEFVRYGDLSSEDGLRIIWSMAEQKALEYHERTNFYG